MELSKTNKRMNKLELKARFTEDFFNEFRFDADFRRVFEGIAKGLTPYEAIEYLCKIKKELFISLKEEIEGKPMRVIVSKKRFDEINKNRIN